MVHTHFSFPEESLESSKSNQLSKTPLQIPPFSVLPPRGQPRVGTPGNPQRQIENEAPRSHVKGSTLVRI